MGLAVDAAGLAIETRGLRKTYRTRHGRNVGVDGLDMHVPAGGVHGFLGPNGSGKTTTIRMLLGLIHADGGTMAVFGQPIPRALPKVIGRIGAIVEQPQFDRAFSARLNLQLLAQGIGVPRTRVDAVLEETGLADRARDKVGGYSLGMRQRLAVAATLLKDPSLLIFDEPTNGLDPAGIHEIREQIRALGAAGRTILVSSHILSEVQQIAESVTIIGQGRVLAEGPVAELTGRAGGHLEVGVPEAERERARTILAGAGFAIVPADGPMVLVDGVDAPDRLVAVLAGQGVYVNHLVTRVPDLESVFLALTQDRAPSGDVEAASSPTPADVPAVEPEASPSASPTEAPRVARRAMSEED
ncbi:MAG: ATP-binding cassette domain-containing protein [Actinomycetia bacterium]|nr:ATP-binding cassette domain-containing protein [Actinomycetes bacterium]